VIVNILLALLSATSLPKTSIDPACAERSKALAESMEAGVSAASGRTWLPQITLESIISVRQVTFLRAYDSLSDPPEVYVFVCAAGLVTYVTGGDTFGFREIVRQMSSESALTEEEQLTIASFYFEYLEGLTPGLLTSSSNATACRLEEAHTRLTSPEIRSEHGRSTIHALVCDRRTARLDRVTIVIDDAVGFEVESRHKLHEGKRSQRY